MEIRLESSVFEENFIARTFSRDFRAEEFVEEITALEQPDIKGTIRQIQLNGFCLVITDIAVPNGYALNISGSSPLFNLHFELEGDYNYTPSDANDPLMLIPGGHFNILYFSKMKGTLKYNTTSRRTLEVLFTEDFLLKAAGEDYHEILKEIRTGVARGQNFSLWKESRQIPSEMQQNIKEIIGCRYCGHIKKIYLEARITALLLNLLVDSNTSGENENVLSKNQHTGVQRVEEYIRDNFSRNITIAELAPIAGINTSKLKQGFKRIHETTIFKYITRLRMEEATRLILEEELSVSEASYKVGYKNPQHFTVAFKKYYGYLPSTLNGKSKQVFG